MSKFKKPSKQAGLFDNHFHAEMMKSYTTSLDKLNNIIDWEYFREPLEEMLNYASASRGGRPAYDPVFMLKVMVVQKYHGLSDEDTEFRIHDSHSIQRFLGVGVLDDMPDRNTIWLFKERLGAKGVEIIFSKFEDCLREKNLIVHPGKIVDASFVEVPRQRNSRKENAQIKSGEVPKDWANRPAKLNQKDTDARWTKKNDEVYYGYKNHIKIDQKSKLIVTHDATPANIHDSQRLKALLRPDDRLIYGDSAYSGEAIANELKQRGIENKIHAKGYRGRPLTKQQKKENTRKSRIRARVEHVFGSLHSWGADFIRTIGIKRARREIGFGNFLYNLIRFSQIQGSMLG